MRIGISTGILTRTETEGALSGLKGLGAQTSEIFLRTFYEYRPEFAKKFAVRLGGVEAHSVHVLPANFEPQLMHERRRERGDGFYWLDQVMRSAQLFGAKNFTFHGIFRKSDTFDNFDFYGDRLREISAFCSGYGVRLCLENVRWALYNRPGVFVELKARVPELMGVFDIKQARKSCHPYEAYLRDMSGAIAHVHLSDVDENGKTCLPGRGVYDFVEIFKQLKDVGFGGAVIIETANFSEPDELKRSVEFLKEIDYKLK